MKFEEARTLLPGSGELADKLLEEGVDISYTQADTVLDWMARYMIGESEEFEDDEEDEDDDIDDELDEEIEEDADRG